MTDEEVMNAIKERLARLVDPDSDPGACCDDLVMIFQEWQVTPQTDTTELRRELHAAKIARFIRETIELLLQGEQR